MNDLQKWGGMAALGHTMALMVGMVLSFTSMFPLLDVAPDQALEFLASHPTLVHVWGWIVDGGSAITLVIMMRALYERLKAGSPAWMQAAAAFGLLWAGLTLGTGSLMLRHFGVVANLFGTVPAQVAAWTALVRSLWVLLLSLASVRAGGPTRAPGYLGVFLGMAGIFTMIPTLAEGVYMVFGPGMMGWSAWVGIVMLRHGAAVTAHPANTLVQRHST